jgi:hypothetical protein
MNAARDVVVIGAPLEKYDAGSTSGLVHSRLQRMDPAAAYGVDNWRARACS